MKRSGQFMKMKQNNEKIVMLTAYDFPTAKLAEQADVDMILVGDSLGMVVLGYESTIPVTVDDMIHHTKAVKRGARDTFVVTDMPFMSYHLSLDETLKNAARIFQEGQADAVKVEGAEDVIGKIAALTNAGVPVVGHLGLTPQSVGVLGGYKVQGKDADAAQKLLEDAKKCEEAGAIALVLECVPHQVSEMITKALDIPTIGIGAGAESDGQVLVFHDVINYGVDRVPKFVKTYGDANGLITAALSQYVKEVKANEFPEEKHTFSMNEGEVAALYGGKS
ncbi:3-methyl-2-oxobutanoate hydroxymethyltransferase [Peribacillus cavernae]|uniref:3-methyl-2-oxobutanoate hydroxymethyltransferase n=1 Tax=Peribacillus cavernae TaxID=1674310 RepID=A0A3S0VZ77_9BACI|nr:3-methyl-2-oxobutanoate hydroxymethyltransferase [Peribacillus cavernae]MDQ0218963.1 3-methyl-2-oxobutanoate hydroxymethyltransferase [Peribacillus cavernae]RUQ29329.1 3-methyl-2-oxobutanoate hydroxymethyltransferase [Peribacillus cavernae]